MRKDKTEITVKYNKLNNSVIGYFPNNIIYPNEVFIDTDSVGYIVITKDEWLNRASSMVVINGVFKEFIKPDSELLQEDKDAKIREIKTYGKKLIDLPIKYLGSTFASNQETILHLQSLYLFKSYAIDLHDIDDNIVNLTKTQAEELGLLLITHRSSVLLQTANKIKDVNNTNSSRKNAYKVNDVVIPPEIEKDIIIPVTKVSNTDIPIENGGDTNTPIEKDFNIKISIPKDVKNINEFKIESS